MQTTSLFNVTDKVVLVTGGSRGIGSMIATGFVANGARVYICSRNAEACNREADRLTAMGPGKCISLPANLAEYSECERLVRELGEREERMDVLVNNAGANWGASIDSYPDAAFLKVLNLNLQRVFTLTQKLLPMLEAAGTASCPSRIINIGSINGINQPILSTFAYSSSKAGLHQLSKHLASHLADRHITVNAIAPGPFPSKMMKAVLDDSKEAVVAGIPLNRIGKPEDIAGYPSLLHAHPARACLFLSSKAGSWVTGVVLPVDGGSLVKARI